ncbi:MAG: hypothetical protein CML06_10175 [Pseudomonadales bacterium]|nr:hypothetical protein [Pseudomonadales bacterium]
MKAKRNRYFTHQGSAGNQRKLSRTVASLALVLTVAAFSPTPLAAQDQARSQTQERKTVKTPALRGKIYQVLSEAQAKAEENKPKEALAILDGLRRRSKLNSYEAAMMWKFYAYIHYSQDNYPEAINSYEQVLAQDALPQALESEALYSTGQLYFIQENYRQAISYLNRWFALVETPKPQAYIMLGQAYYQLEQLDKARKPIETAVAMTERKGKIPKESWYLLLRALYFEQNDYARAADVLEKLVRHYPKKDYWVQLSSAYGEMNKERQQLNAMEIAYRQDLLDRESEWLNLAQLFIYQDIPYKAARVLEQGMDRGIVTQNERNLKLLSYAWSTAQEARKALPVLVKAAEASATGELDVQLGSTYYRLDEWKNAVSYLRQGLDKGDVKNVDNAYMLLGLSLFNLDRFEDARYAFKQAAKYEGSKTVASQWLNYVDKEMERREILAQTRKAMEARR